ncbi:BspA family leucine-rich repeat surface protein [Mycoplasma capricolum]|uniref:BspA family leucine-rich repeat surface protein n=1 Tax=Mycoplasma capricolum TaxID=2095 RepID=UPI003DA1D10A
MKKILTILTSFSLIATSSFLVVACKPYKAEKKIEIPKVISDSNREKEENNKDKKPESKIDQSQNDQLRNSEKKDTEKPNFNSLNTTKENILSSIEDERSYINNYYNWWIKNKYGNVNHFINPKNPNEILFLGYEKSKDPKDGYKLKEIPTNINKVPSKLPKLITSLESAFKNNKNERIEGIETWDTSNIKNMYQTFFGAENFNGNITQWKTDKVENMGYMFAYTKSFNKDLSSWNVTKTPFQTNFAYSSSFEGKKQLWPPFRNRE